MAIDSEKWKSPVRWSCSTWWAAEQVHTATVHAMASDRFQREKLPNVSHLPG